jgi:mannose/fructose/N-acetylgalactosamine-specific phosphotransferase system component IIC
VRSLEEKWRQANTVAAGPEQVMQVAVPIGSLDDWVQTKRRIAQVPTISRADLVTLTRGAAKVELYYRGSPEVLANALALQDLSLTEAPPLDQGAIQAGLPATPGTLASPVPVMGQAGQPVGVYQPGPVWQLRWTGSTAQGNGGRTFGRAAP